MVLVVLWFGSIISFVWFVGWPVLAQFASEPDDKALAFTVWSVAAIFGCLVVFASEPDPDFMPWLMQRPTACACLVWLVAVTAPAWVLPACMLAAAGIAVIIGVLMVGLGAVLCTVAVTRVGAIIATGVTVGTVAGWAYIAFDQGLGTMQLLPQITGAGCGAVVGVLAALLVVQVGKLRATTRTAQLMYELLEAAVA